MADPWVDNPSATETADPSEEEKRRRQRRSGAPPPARVRDPKKHSRWSNLFSGIESIPRSAFDQEEAWRHAIAHDVSSGEGLLGAVGTPLDLLLMAGKSALPGHQDERGKLLGRATAPVKKYKKPGAVYPLIQEAEKGSLQTPAIALGLHGTKAAGELWHDNPLAALGSALIVTGPATRALGIGKMATSIRAANRVPLKGGGTRAMTRAEATKAAAVESYYPGTLDKLGIEGSPLKPRSSGRRVSRTPTGRASQRAFDWGSEKIDVGVGVGRLKTGKDTPLSTTRRAAAGERRADDLERSRMVTNAMRHVSTFADYLNDTALSRVGTAFGRRKETLASRDAAVGAALHASTAIDPVDAVRHAAEDTRRIINSDERTAHRGDIGDVEPDKRVGQTVFVTHGRDENGEPMLQRATVIADEDGKVTVSTPQGERTIKHGWAHLVGPDGQGKIPLSADEIKMLERRERLLNDARDELTSEPKLEQKFRAAVQSMTDFGQENEQLGQDFFLRGMDPTGSEAMATYERLDNRRNQFVPRLGGTGAEPINYDAGLWGDLQSAMGKANFPDDQQHVFLKILDHRARDWANEVEGRQPADYLASPEGKNLGGIDFAKPEDLEATLNALFQTAGERNHLVKTTTTTLITGPPKVGDLVSTPYGMGWIRMIEDHDVHGRAAQVDMAEGGAHARIVPIKDVRVAEFPWTGRPTWGDYVQTPDGPGLLAGEVEGPGPDFEMTYHVQLSGDVEATTYGPGQVQKIGDPSMDEPVFHLASQQALGGEKFPTTKATAEQYLKAFKTAGVGADEFYWMGLSRRPMLEGEAESARAAVATVEKKMAEDPEQMFRYRDPGEEDSRTISGDDLLAILRPERDRAEQRLAEYPDDPDPTMLLDAHWGGKSFPAQAVQDAVNSRAHFLDLKEHLYSSEAPDRQWQDKYGMSGSYGDGGLVIREGTAEHPYHELVIALPNSDLFRQSHWPRQGEESHLVHIRFHEIVDNEGKRALLIDEIQSDWNHLGRKHGFRAIPTPRDVEKAKMLRDRERRLVEMTRKLVAELGFGKHELDNWLDRLVREKGEEMNRGVQERNTAREEARAARGEDHLPTPQDPNEPPVFPYGRDRDRIVQELVADHADDPIYHDLMKTLKRFNRWERKRTDTRHMADALETGGARHSSVNRGPLMMGDAARYLALKRMVRWAADHDQERIIWTRGHEHGVRYEKFEELPVEEKLPDPSDFGDDFYYPATSLTSGFGSHYGKRVVPESGIREMNQVAPVEVRYDNPSLDNEHLGDTFMLIPAESLPPGISGQMSFSATSGLEQALPPPYSATGGYNRNPRFGEIIRDDGETMLVKPIDPEWDPAKFSFEYRGNSGGDTWGSWDVSVVNRLGDEIYRDTLEGSFDTRSNLLAAMKKEWERANRNWAPAGQAVEITEANVAKMHQLIDILEQSDNLSSEFDYAMRNMERKFDEHGWQDFLDNQEEGGSAHGDFEDIRDHEPRKNRYVQNLRDEITDMERMRQQDIEAGVMRQDYDSKLRRMKIGLEQAKDDMENKAHKAGYDEMVPLMVNRLLKPYRKEADHVPVEIKQKIYRGRYSTQNMGVISSEGDLHGWVLDLPKKMREDAKGTTSLFQKGNDIIKGASTWVGGEDGQRFIALTEHADFSTLMHEFIGHATEEFKRRYPELWEPVERDMGLPLEQWKKSHHEKFAKYVERYWMEGKAPSPELVTVMGMIKEWMKGVYSSITQLGRPMPESTRILLNRHLGQGTSAREGARTYVPHISIFDTVMDHAPGGTRLGAGGNVVGVPKVDRRNFGARRNRGVLWESGELALSARPIIDQYFRRTKFLETERVRQELYDEGHPMPKNGRPPKGAWLVRNPGKPPERLTARNTTRVSEEDFSRMIGEGDTPDEFLTKMQEIRADHYAEPGEHPPWANDLENTRWVEGGKISNRIQNVFPSAPRGRGAATVGSMNAMARLAGIYLRPIHYLVGNIPQNVLLVALTNPSALVNSVKYGAYAFLPRVIREMGVQPRDLFAHDRHLYNRIKTETGDIQAGAGLPDFYTQANNGFQKAERKLNKISQWSAEKLGEAADQPYRVSVWMGHAKKYGYNTPDEWRQLLDSERGSPEARIRDDIAQATREDMIDFNTLSPWERQNVGRFFYLWAFTRGFAKWPLTYAREYPGRVGAAMMLADPERQDDNKVPLSWLPASGVLKTNQGPGKVRDLDFLDPTQGLRQQIETAIQLAHGNIQGIGGMTTPPLETALQSITGGPRAPKGGIGGLADQLARDVVPGYDIYRKAVPGNLGGTPGLGLSERLRRVFEYDRFQVKDEIGKGKNAEKKRIEDEKIKAILTKADRLDVLPLAMHQQDAYWHHKYLEQQIRFGALARRKGKALNDEEKTTILYATAKEYFPEIDLPPLETVLKTDPAVQEEYRSEIRDAIFSARNEVLAP